MSEVHLRWEESIKTQIFCPIDRESCLVDQIEDEEIHLLIIICILTSELRLHLIFILYSSSEEFKENKMLMYLFQKEDKTSKEMAKTQLLKIQMSNQISQTRIEIKMVTQVSKISMVISQSSLKMKKMSKSMKTPIQMKSWMSWLLSKPKNKTSILITKINKFENNS